MKKNLGIVTLAVLVMLGIIYVATMQKDTIKTTETGKDHPTVVLVHGAWADAHAWYRLQPLLEAKGFEVVTVNLPAHGPDTTPIENVQFSSYVNAVKTAIGERTGVILVGHSMAGMVISQVAEDTPQQIGTLVYLGAYLPLDGQDLYHLSQTDTGSSFGKYLRPNASGTALILAKEGIKGAVAQDVTSSEDIAWLASQKPEPIAPFATPVHLTQERFGAVPKVYIHTTQDHTVSYPFQQAMVASSTGIVKTYTVESSHVPFLTVPDALADVIGQI